MAMVVTSRGLVGVDRWRAMADAGVVRAGRTVVEYGDYGRVDSFEFRKEESSRMRSADAKYVGVTGVVGGAQVRRTIDEAVRHRPVIMNWDTGEVSEIDPASAYIPWPGSAAVRSSPVAEVASGGDGVAAAVSLPRVAQTEAVEVPLLRAQGGQLLVDGAAAVEACPRCVMDGLSVSEREQLRSPSLGLTHFQVYCAAYTRLCISKLAVACRVCGGGDVFEHLASLQRSFGLCSGPCSQVGGVSTCQACSYVVELVKHTNSSRSRGFEWQVHCLWWLATPRLYSSFGNLHAVTPDWVGRRLGSQWRRAVSTVYRSGPACLRYWEEFGRREDYPTVLAVSCEKLDVQTAADVQHMDVEVVPLNEVPRSTTALIVRSVFASAWLCCVGTVSEMVSSVVTRGNLAIAARYRVIRMSDGGPVGELLRSVPTPMSTYVSGDFSVFDRSFSGSESEYEFSSDDEADGMPELSIPVDDVD